MLVVVVAVAGGAACEGAASSFDIGASTSAMCVLNTFTFVTPPRRSSRSCDGEGSVAKDGPDGIKVVFSAGGGHQDFVTTRKLL